MPFPFLVWGAAALAAAAGAAMLADDGGSSSSGNSGGSNRGPSREEAERKRREAAKKKSDAAKRARKQEELEDFCRMYDIPLGHGAPSHAFGRVTNYVYEYLESNVAQPSAKYTQAKSAKKKLKKAKTIEGMRQACKGTGIQFKRLAKPFVDRNEVAKPVVAVMGQMNGGKSALLNGIVGDEIFSVADRRETAKIKKHEMEHFIFMDTPGSDSLFEDEKAALAGLQEANAFIFVHSVEQGDLTQPEIRYLQTAIDQILGSELLSQNFFVVLNKADKGKGDAVQKVVERQLKELGIQPRAVVQASAKRMTDAKKYSDQKKQGKLLEKSGLFEIQGVLGNLHADMAGILKKQKAQQLEKLRSMLLVEVSKIFEQENKAYKAEQKRVKKENKELSEAWNQFTAVYNNI